MADRGFNIKENLALIGVGLYKQQLDECRR